MSNENAMAYLAVCSHGKTRCIAVDPNIGEHSQQYKKALAKEMAQWIKEGLTIKHVDIETARQSDIRCGACDEAHGGSVAVNTCTPAQKNESCAAKKEGD